MLKLHPIFLAGLVVIAGAAPALAQTATGGPGEMHAGSPAHIQASPSESGPGTTAGTPAGTTGGPIANGTTATLGPSSTSNATGAAPGNFASTTTDCPAARSPSTATSTTADSDHHGKC